jgi:hypothetical protein
MQIKRREHACIDPNCAECAPKVQEILEKAQLRVNPWTGEVLEDEPEVIAPTHAQFGQKLTEVPVGTDLPSPDELRDELLGYCDILLGRVAPPVESPYLGLAEIATAYYARACEMDMLIHEEERAGRVIRGHSLYRFRTGALRSFLEMSKKMADLGSRRLTQEQVLMEARYDSGETY